MWKEKVKFYYWWLKKKYFLEDEDRDSIVPILVDLLNLKDDNYLPEVLISRYYHLPYDSYVDFYKVVELISNLVLKDENKELIDLSGNFLVNKKLQVWFGEVEDMNREIKNLVLLYRELLYYRDRIEENNYIRRYLNLYIEHLGYVIKDIYNLVMLNQF